MKKQLFALIALAALAVEAKPHKWVFAINAFAEDAEVAYVSNIVTRAKACGMNGLCLLSGGGYTSWTLGPDRDLPTPEYVGNACGLESWDKWDAKRRDRFNAVRRYCDAVGVDIVPLLWSPGYFSMRFENPSWVAVFPVKDVPATAENGKVTCAGRNLDVKVETAGEWQGDVLKLDVGKLHDAKRTAGGTIRVKAKPYTRYRVSLKFKTEGFTGRDYEPSWPTISFYVNDGVCAGGCARKCMTANQDWVEHTKEMNSLYHTEFTVAFGSYTSHARGNLYVKDIVVEECGIDQPVKREGCDFVVKDAATGKVYEEGRDYANVPYMKALAWPAKGEPITFDVVKGGAIKDGARLLVSAYEPPRSMKKQFSMCPSVPGIGEFMKKAADNVVAATGSRTWLLSLDEIRNECQCSLCRARNETIAEKMGKHITELVDVFRARYPGVELYAWCDMLNPYDNPKQQHYYNCLTTWQGAWDHIPGPEKLKVAYWGEKPKADEIEFFRTRGYRGIACGYYDYDPQLKQPAKWCAEMNAHPEAFDGWMYTTWEQQHGQIEDFAKIMNEGVQDSCKGEKYGALRRELRAFHPEECHQECKDAALVASHKKMREEVQAWAKAHPGYDALDVRREYYQALRRNFLPKLFVNSPYYFENGINGGWCEKYNPARVVNGLCWRFYEEQGLVPKEAFALQSARQKESLALCCGPFCDNMHHVPPLRTILSKGFRGVYEEVKAALAKCPANDPRGKKELETALVGLETIHALQLKFAEEAERLLADQNVSNPSNLSNASNVSNVSNVSNLRRIAAAAKRCPWEPPQNLYEGLNTIWFVREIVSLADGTDIFSLGRPDAFFIDTYRREIAAGTLTKAEARELVDKFLVHSDCHMNTDLKIDSYSDQEAEMPMSVGGHDAKGNFVYNELTDMLLDSHLENNLVFPKMHARIASDAPAAYLEKIGSMLMKGHAVFTLLNDDRYIRQYLDEGFSYEDASSYIGVGCWNGFIDSVQDLDEANYLSMIKILEMSIHRDAEKEKRCGLVLEPMDDAKNFEELRDIYWRNFHRYLMSIASVYSRYGATGTKVFPHPVYSMCLRGCIESRRDTNEGGSVSHPRVLTLGFIGNAVDSILAIDHVCFRRRLATVKEFLDAVRSNWAGARGEELRRAAFEAPYWGDGSQAAADLFSTFLTRAREATDGMDNGFGGPYRYAIYAYREFMYWGMNTKATPDGRRNGERLAQGFSPSEYRCREGVTTVMNSIGMLPHEKLYASNVNLTFDASAMNEKLLAAILRVFCRKGSHMIQPNCNSVEELLDAQRHPERHRDLIVRVCGFSARFVSLSKRWQDEVIARHRLK